MIQDGVHVFFCSRFRSSTQPFWRCTCVASCHVCSLRVAELCGDLLLSWASRSGLRRCIKEANERAKTLAKELADAKMAAVYAKSKLLVGNLARVRVLA